MLKFPINWELEGNYTPLSIDKAAKTVIVQKNWENVCVGIPLNQIPHFRRLEDLYIMYGWSEHRARLTSRIKKDCEQGVFLFPFFKDYVQPINIMRGPTFRAIKDGNVDGEDNNDGEQPSDQCDRKEDAATPIAKPPKKARRASKKSGAEMLKTLKSRMGASELPRQD